MPTQDQIDANRANSQLSTGPKSPEGKARVSQNARKHGLTAVRLVIRDDEREDFETLRNELFYQLAPEGAVETVTFEEILHAAWNLHRFRSIESELCTGALDDFTNPETVAVLDRLTRYQSRAQRAYYRALQELRTLQTDRALRTLKLNTSVEPVVPALTAINELTKQSRYDAPSQTIDRALRLAKPDHRPHPAPYAGYDAS
jgi:hypothetical protein